MKRLLALILVFFACLVSYGQQKTYPPRPWMFTLEETVQLPGVSKEEIEKRSYKARKNEEKADIQHWNSIIGDTINLQTMNRVIEFHPWFIELGTGREKYSMLMHFTMAIIPYDGYYKIQLQRLEVTAYRKDFRVFDDIVRSDEPGPDIQGRKKHIEPVQALAKDYAREFFRDFSARIQESMAHPDFDFELVEVK